MADFSKGWITLLRCLQEHKLWGYTPFSKGQAWLDLILTTNHKDNNIMIGNTSIDIKRSQLLTSQLQLSKKWGWSRHKVHNFLVFLEKENMITLKTHIQKDNGFTLITLLNYNNLQNTKPIKRTTKRTTTGQLRDNYGTQTKNVKNVNNDKEIKDTPSKNEGAVDKPVEKKQSIFTNKEKEVLEAVRAKVNIYALIEEFKNFHKVYPSKDLLMRICRQFLDKQAEIKEPYPYLKASLHRATQDEENQNWKKQGMAQSIKEILGIKKERI